MSNKTYLPNVRPSRPLEHKDAWDLNFVTDFLERKFNVRYKSGEASSVYSTVGGTMTDWVYEGLGVVRTYILELLRWANWQCRMR